MTWSSLDNPVWHALSGPHRGFAEMHGRARRYKRNVSVFSAVDALDDIAWADLADCVDENEAILLIRDELPAPPAGWAETWRFRLHQMVLDELRPARAGAEVRPLGPDDVEAMLELASVAEPGPFVRGTPHLGGYVGVFDDEQLIAMAGRRMRLAGMTELSAVCTRPEARGRGLGELVSHAVASAISAEGNTAFLHTAVDNFNAIRLYERLGFRHHQDVDIAGYRRV